MAVLRLGNKIQGPDRGREDAECGRDLVPRRQEPRDRVGAQEAGPTSNEYVCHDDRITLLTARFQILLLLVPAGTGMTAVS
jgi:hypothetical protein